MSHIHEKIDFCDDVLIVENNTVLLRKHEKYHLWLAVGGHIELDEDPNQAAIRECKEEVNLDIVLFPEAKQNFDTHRIDLVAPQFINRHRISDTHEHVSLIYFARAANPHAMRDNEGTLSVGDLHWFSESDLNNEDYEIPSDLRTHALAAIQYFKNQNI